MFKHILLPTDGSELSDKAVKQAIEVATVYGARITALKVIEQCQFCISDEGFTVPDLREVERRVDEGEAERAKQILAAVKESAGQAGIHCVTAAPTSNTPHEAIIQQAEESRCDLIIMASHGRKGLKGLLLGSETVKVLTHSTIPVLVCR